MAVVGATASGKTSLSVRLAEAFDGEIVCCDSMQIYRYLDIATAKPTEEERHGIPHHLFGEIDPRTTFSCADYAPLASQAAEGILSRGKLPIFCGGTGLYLNSVLRISDFSDAPSDPNYREELRARAEREGAQALWNELEKVDPEAASATHPNNVRRVIRALEIVRATGVTKTEWDRKSRENASPYDTLILGLRYRDREILNRRIDLRIDEMMRAGLYEETERLYAEGLLTGGGAQAIGYKELLPTVLGERSLDASLEALRIATHQYAKRQMTWFGRDESVVWIDADEDGKRRDDGAIYEEALALARKWRNE